jgi:hypothetical protein
LLLVVSATAAESSYRQIVDGVAVYFGMMPAELVRGHPPEHPEGQMHGGTPVGENHIMVALFEDKTGKRLTGAEVSARVTGEGGLDVRKRLDSMLIAGAQSYGNYFYLPGTGPYRIDVRIRLPGAARELRATFTWARS